ncbi:hypothetical protein H4R24_004699, partial [Coemansia sp. RSA 988]
EETVMDEWLHMMEFERCAEPLMPQLAHAMGTTKCHSLEVMGPMTHQTAPVDNKCHTLLSKLGKVDKVEHSLGTDHVLLDTLF